jgi:HEAT repeats
MADAGDVDKALNEWKTAVEEFAVSAGAVTAAFQRIHRDRFKEREVIIVNSPRVDYVLNRLIKAFESGNRTVRWRAAYVLGEVMRLHSSEKGRQKAVTVLLKSLSDPRFQVRAPVGTEVVNALGKSEDSRAASALLQVLNDKWGDASNSPHVFVSLGKVGNDETVAALSQFLSKSNLPKSGEIFLPWAMGMLGRLDCRREGFPIPRPPFRPGLKHLQRMIESADRQLEQYRNAIYAVGRICDQRGTVPRPKIEVGAGDLKAVKQVLEGKRNRLSKNGDANSKQQVQMIDLAMTLIEGADLSKDQVILLEKVETILLVKVEEGGPALA